ncbi:MAG: ATP-binding protein, partial [Chloroflexia bacterium]
YDLLEPNEKDLFGTMSVFTGGGTLEAVEAVGTGLGSVHPGLSETLIPDRRPLPLPPLTLIPLTPEIDILDVVSSLLDKSLLNRRESPNGETRLWMLQTIKEFAGEQLELSPEANEVRERHSTFYLDMAEAAAPRLRGPRAAEQMDTLEAEFDNLRTALAWMLDAGHSEPALRMAVALWRFWEVRGHITEGRQWLDKALSSGQWPVVSGQSPHTTTGHYSILARARALEGAGVLAQHQGDQERSRALLDEGLALYEQIQDKEGIAYMLNHQGSVEILEGDNTAARRLFERSLALFRDVGSPPGMVYPLTNLGEVDRQEDDYAAALGRYEEALSLVRAAGWKDWLVIALQNLGHAVHHQGDAKRASGLFAEALVAGRDIGFKPLVGFCLAGMAGVAGSLEQPERAARLFGAADALLAALHVPLDPADRTEYERNLAAAQAQVDEETWRKAWDEGQAMTMGQAVDYALENEA